MTLERAMERFTRRRREQREAEQRLATLSAPAFRALMDQRLRTLEREMAEVRTRINGLLFVVAGAAVTQIVLRLLG